MSQNRELMRKDMFAGCVTSLHFLDEAILLVGHGPFLKVYNVQTGCLLACETVLRANRIHRIVPVPDIAHDEKVATKFAVYGSKHIGIVSIETSPSEASISIQRIFGPFKDWILDIQWLVDEDKKPSELAVAYAHNFVEIYKMSPTPELVDSVQCEVRCILYSARFFGNTRETLIMASGTVFNEVHLWKMAGRNANGDGEVYRKLIGHEGVIFGIRFSVDGSMAASVSDDRTIRVWPLDDSCKKQTPYTIFGHSARIWDCQFVDEYLVSISEDSTCRVWRNVLLGNEDEIEGSDVDCLACWDGHIGRNVWSCAISPEHKVVATGGQDSGVRLWSLTSIKVNKIDSEADLQSVQLPEPYSQDDLIRNFALTDKHTTVILTSEGRLLHQGTDATWTILHEDPDFRDFGVIQNSLSSDILVAGSLYGHLLIVNVHNMFKPIKIQAHDQKIMGILVEASKDPGIYYIISHSLRKDYYVHCLDTTNGTEPTLHTLFQLELPALKTTIISAALAEKEGLLICGARESALLIYRLPSLRDSTQHKKLIHASLQLRRSHGREAVSSVFIKPTNNKNNILFWTTGRDGCYIEYRLKNILNDAPTTIEQGLTQLGVASRGDDVVKCEDMVLEKVYRNKVTKGWLEGLLLVDNELLLLGFYRKKFFVYNESKRYEMLSVTCGGSHRRWQFVASDAKLSKTSFMFHRKLAVNAHIRNGLLVASEFQKTVLQDHFHGREVRVLRYLDLLPKDQPMLFATGGEDTMLRIQQYMPSAVSKFVTVCTVRKHRSVIKSLDVSQGIEPLLFSSGGSNELRCWKLEIHPSSSADLLDVHCLELATCPMVTEDDIETRVMDTTVLPFDRAGGLHLIAAVYSDATIRIWLFSETSRKFSLIVDGTWHAKCILQVAHVALKDGRLLFFTSATDGRVAIWDINEPLMEVMQNVNLESDPTKSAMKLTKPIYQYDAHMSGINALQVVPHQDEKTFLIITGGDDNAVVATVVQLGQDNLWTTITTDKVPNAHASSVTGVTIVRDKIFTVSTDQRLNMWAFHNDKLTLTGAEFVDVPDPSTIDGVEINGEAHVSTAGIGMQSIRCKLNGN